MRLPFNGSFRLTQAFGGNPQAYARFGLKGHDGLDYGLPTGTPIYAPFSGKVTQTGYDGPGYGKYIKIENDKYGTVLAHLQNYSVIVGQQVAEGQQIATSDNTGNSTGPHLHWGVHPIPRDKGNGYAGYINQLPLIGVNPPTNGGVPVNYQQGSGKFDQVVKLLNQNKLIDYDNPERYYSNDDVNNAIKRLIENQGNPETQIKLNQAKALGKQITEL